MIQRSTREQVVANAKEYAQAHGLDVELFGRAALVARDPDGFDRVPELSGEEQYALAYERDHKWHGSKMMWFSM
jgi:hypothetical protein